MTSSSTRLFLGCIAGAISVLIFHQATLELLFWLGYAPVGAFRLAIAQPLNVPMVVSVTFWGAVYGAVFGWFEPRLPRSFLPKALVAALFATFMTWFVVRPMAGYPMAFNWQTAPMLRSLASCLMWGVGIALILPLLQPRGLNGRHRWKRNLAT